MTVITSYISDDGLTFYDELECLRHELDIMESYSGLKVYGAHNKILHKFYDDDIYNAAKKIVVPSDTALKHLEALKNYSGFYYDIQIDISSIGTWKYSDKDGKWEKILNK